jgi:hypothetical protein
MVFNLHIPQDGLVRLRVEARRGITAVEYKMDVDDRISFLGEGWKNFLQSKHLQTGQAILITPRTTCRHLQMIFFIDIINDSASSGLELDSED